MTKTETAAYSNLQALQAQVEHDHGASSHGLKDLGVLPLSADLLADIRACIDSNDHIAITEGLFVLQGIMHTKNLSDLPRDFMSYLLKRLDVLLDTPMANVFEIVVVWYVQLCSSYPDFRQRMLELLASKNLGHRELALRYYPTFCKPSEVEPLLRFENDDYASDVRPLGDWEYVLRDRALDLIEKQIGVQFPRIRLNEPYQGARVSWYDWRPFLQWWSAAAK